MRLEWEERPFTDFNECAIQWRSERKSLSSIERKEVWKLMGGGWGLCGGVVIRNEPCPTWHEARAAAAAAAVRTEAQSVGGFFEAAIRSDAGWDSSVPQGPAWHWVCECVCVCVCVCVWALRFILPNHASWRGWHEKRLSAVIVPMLAAFFFVISFFFFYAPARLTGLTMRTAQTRILFPSAVTRQVGRSLPLALVPHYLIAFSFHCWPFLFRLSFNGPMAGCGRGVLRGSCDVVRPAASASSSSSSPSTSSSPLSSSS